MTGIAPRPGVAHGAATRLKTTVAVVCPGFFRTNLAESLRAADAHSVKVTEKLVGGARRSAAEVADLVYEGAMRGESHVLTHTDGLVTWLVKRLVPFSLYEAFLSRSTRFFVGAPVDPGAGQAAAPRAAARRR